MVLFFLLHEDQKSRMAPIFSMITTRNISTKVIENINLTIKRYHPDICMRPFIDNKNLARDWFIYISVGRQIEFLLET